MPLLVHKHDQHAVQGWDSEDHPRSVLSGRTNEQVAADPDRVWRSDAPAAEADVSLLPDALPDEAIDDLEAMGKQGTWSVFGRELRVTDLDKGFVPGRPNDQQARVPGVLREDRPRRSCLPGRPRPEPASPPERGTAQGLLAQAATRPRTALGGRWDNPEADEGETVTYLVADEPAALVWAANFGALEWRPWTSQTEAMHQPSYALLDLDPGQQESM